MGMDKVLRMLVLGVVAFLVPSVSRAQSTNYKAADPFGGGNTFTLYLSRIAPDEWCYPLPKGKVISRYGGRGGYYHKGTDIKSFAKDSILAAFDGIVTMSQPFAGYGNCIIIRHSNGLETLYSHNYKNHVKVGEFVRAGQFIALTGRTGRASTEHLHFEVHVGGHPINSAIIFDHETHRLKTDSLLFIKGGGVKIVELLK
jgi:murein DD-endopeptidase MepM/ murein hydrolase activator NlpD